MQTPPCPLCGRVGCVDTRHRRRALYDRGAAMRPCSICAGSLADHTTADHSAKVVERLAALGYPMPAEVDVA